MSGQVSKYPNSSDNHSDLDVKDKNEVGVTDDMDEDIILNEDSGEGKLDEDDKDKDYVEGDDFDEGIVSRKRKVKKRRSKSVLMAKKKTSQAAKRSPPGKLNKGPPAMCKKGPPSKCKKEPPNKCNKAPPSRCKKVPPNKCNKGPPRKFGRRLSSVWGNFKTVIIQTQGYEGHSSKVSQCLKCKRIVSSKACRLNAHLLNCPKKGENQFPNLQSYEDMLATTSTTSFPIVKLNSSSQIDDKNVSAHGSVPQQFTLQRFVAGAKRLQDNEKLQIDKQIGRFIFAANLSFETVEHPEFQKMVSLLHPGYQPPKAESIGSNILNTVYAEVQEEIKSDVANKMVVIMQDGWSTAQSFPVISHIIHTSERSYYLDSVQPAACRKTAEYCARLLLAALDKAEKLFNLKVCGFVTDNCSMIDDTRQIVQDAKPEMILYGCSSHLLNLVGTKMMPSEILDQVIKVHTYFRNQSFWNAELKRLQGVRPMLPEATKWSSQVDCITSYLQNQHLYAEIERNAEIQGQSFDVDVRAIIQDTQLFFTVQRLATILQPIATALDNLQREESTIADAVQEWLSLVQNPMYTEDERQIIVTEMQKGVTAASAAAYMLHPAKRGEGLDSQYEEYGRQWLAAKDPAFIFVVTALKHRDTSLFPQSFLEASVLDVMKPSLWWQGLKGWPGISEGVIDVAVRLMICPASTSSLERCFSIIVSKLRNHIGVEKATKLCTISRYLKGNLENTW